MYPRLSGIILFTLIFLTCCNQRKELVDQPLYDGPISSLDSVNTLFSESGRFKMRIQAPKQSEFESGNIEWSNGAQVTYYDNVGNITTFFSADYIYYTQTENLYHAKGQVVVKNHENGDELTTEELYWDKKKEKYYTEKFVTIKSDGEIHTGEGLDANQDFSTYQILKPTGTFVLENDP